MAINTAYRIFEIVGNMNFNQKVFLLLSPLGLASAGAIYLTRRKIRHFERISFPLIESAARFCIFLGCLSKRRRGSRHLPRANV